MTIFPETALSSKNADSSTLRLDEFKLEEFFSIFTL
jgi:hypothetical protein